MLGRLTINRSLRDVLSDMVGAALPADAKLANATWRQLVSQPYPPERLQAIQAFFSDLRDTATTEEMCQLLSCIWRCDGLSSTGSGFILDCMRRCATGSRRLKDRLPPGTRFAHKTGSLEVGLTADMGIIESSATGAAIAVCAFVMGSPESQDRQDRVLARLGRAVHEFHTAPIFALRSKGAASEA
jgi:beta-lactamase class A